MYVCINGKLRIIAGLKGRVYMWPNLRNRLIAFTNKKSYRYQRV